jgi:hypothetical protein
MCARDRARYKCRNHLMWPARAWNHRSRSMLHQSPMLCDCSNWPTDGVGNVQTAEHCEMPPVCRERPDCKSTLLQELWTSRYCSHVLLLLQIRTQPHLGCRLAAATTAASAIFMHLCTNSATPYTSQQHMRSCNDVNGSCANRRSRLTTAVAGHGKRRLPRNVVATEVETGHAKHQRMWNAQPCTQIWSRIFTQRCGAKALHASVLHCSTRMQELLPAAPSHKQNGLSHHVQVGWIAHVHLLTTQYTNKLEKPG